MTLFDISVYVMYTRIYGAEMHSFWEGRTSDLEEKVSMQT